MGFTAGARDAIAESFGQPAAKAFASRQHAIEIGTVETSKKAPATRPRLPECRHKVVYGRHTHTKRELRSLSIKAKAKANT